jgi:hypothetical protein
MGKSRREQRIVRAAERPSAAPISTNFSPELIQHAQGVVDARAARPPVSLDEWARTLAADVIDLND